MPSLSSSSISSSHPCSQLPPLVPVVSQKPTSSRKGADAIVFLSPGSINYPHLNHCHHHHCNHEQSLKTMVLIIFEKYWNIWVWIKIKISGPHLSKILIIESKALFSSWQMRWMPFVATQVDFQQRKWTEFYICRTFEFTPWGKLNPHF